MARGAVFRVGGGGKFFKIKGSGGGGVILNTFKKTSRPTTYLKEDDLKDILVDAKGKGIKTHHTSITSI